MINIFSSIFSFFCKTRLLRKWKYDFKWWFYNIMKNPWIEWSVFLYLTWVDIKPHKIFFWYHSGVSLIDMRITISWLIDWCIMIKWLESNFGKLRVSRHQAEKKNSFVAEKLPKWIFWCSILSVLADRRHWLMWSEVLSKKNFGPPGWS